MTGASLSSLPVDVFLLICTYLDASSFVQLTSTCKSLQTTFKDESSIWSSLVRDTFRVANQPVIEHDGARWRKLFRRLKTETHAYTWGSNTAQCIGQTARLRAQAEQYAHTGRRVHLVSWPEEMDDTTDFGIISEMQCGGWSTSLLNSKGQLRIAGVIDGMEGRQMASNTTYTTLSYPPSFSSSPHRHEPATAVKQYSHGRQHLLALSDSGRIWAWQNAAHAAFHIKFLHHDTVEGKVTGRGSIRKVVAGWSKSAALIEGSGIVVWDPVRRQNNQDIEDTLLVVETAAVPQTDAIDTAQATFAVKNFIVLEQVVVFVTFDGRVFASIITWNQDDHHLAEPQLIDGSSIGTAIDVQGSFRSFAVFTDQGDVLISSQDRLFLALSTSDFDAVFDRIPALQQSQVIALAFGDYHYHALHAPGHITSYGKEPQSCGAFGLGSNTPEARLRGVRQQGMQGPGFRHASRADGYLVPHANHQGRRVWFEREKRDWIKFIASGGCDPGEAVERIRMALGSARMEAQGELSEWIEQEGRDWEEKYNVRTEGDDGLPAYFALNVAAAGWHSGALVLVNDRLATAMKTAVERMQEESEQTGDDVSGTASSWFTRAVDFGRWFLGLPTQPPLNVVDNITQPHDTPHRDPAAYGAAPRAGSTYVWSGDHFPRLQLADGTEMPGDVPFDSWRYGRPDWQIPAAT